MKTDLKLKLIQEHGIYSLCDVQAYLLWFFSFNSTLNVLYLLYYMPREESNKQDKKTRISLLVQKRRVLESLFLRHSESLFLPHSGVFVSSTLLHSFWKWTWHRTIKFQRKGNVRLQWMVAEITVAISKCKLGKRKTRTWTVIFFNYKLNRKQVYQVRKKNNEVIWMDIKEIFTASMSTQPWIWL